MNPADFNTFAIRIAETLGKEMGGRFDILGDFATEAADGSPTRTVRILDRWSDQDATIEIRCGARRG
jgi:hypothetical protein